MNVLIISASMRSQSQSLKVSNWLCNHARSLGHQAELLDLHAFNLPSFDDGETKTDQQVILLEQVSLADAYVFVSPEWNGMMSYGLINMLHYVKHEMAYKPVMLVGVSSGRGGTHPLDQMKLIGQKNRHYIISPENLIVSGVNDAFNSPELDENAADYAVKTRAEYGLKVLAELSSALHEFRASGVIDLERFANGV